MTVTKAYSTQDLANKDKAHLLHRMSNLAQLREHGPSVMCKGEDVFRWDTDGKKHIDAFAGLWNINVGHGRSEPSDVAAKQMRELAFAPNFSALNSPPTIELAVCDGMQ